MHGILHTRAVLIEVAVRDNVVLVIIVESIVAGADLVGDLYLGELVVVLQYIRLNISRMEVL